MQAIAYVNWGLWVADCPRPSCPGSEHHQSHCGQGHCIKGHRSGLTDAQFECSNCGGVYGVEWPVDASLIDAALSRRVVPQTRNWHPGESVDDLLSENTAHASEVI